SEDVSVHPGSVEVAGGVEIGPATVEVEVASQNEPGAEVGAAVEAGVPVSQNEPGNERNLLAGNKVPVSQEESGAAVGGVVEPVPPTAQNEPGGEAEVETATVVAQEEPGVAEPRLPFEETGVSGDSRAPMIGRYEGAEPGLPPESEPTQVMRMAAS